MISRREMLRPFAILSTFTLVVGLTVVGDGGARFSAFARLFNAMPFFTARYCSSARSPCVPAMRWQHLDCRRSASTVVVMCVQRGDFCIGRGFMTLGGAWGVPKRVCRLRPGRVGSAMRPCSASWAKGLEGQYKLEVVAVSPIK
jgi:hypothetical protein